MSDEPQNESPASDLATLPDDVLLLRFVRDGSEDAFRTIVDRYGPLVLSTCRRGAPVPSDADDAFQATFYVLARSAGKVRNGKSLGAWLYGVAFRVCARLRRDKARQGATQLMEEIATEPDPLDELLARHDEMVTDEELAQLPERLRVPLVLRYLAGKSNAAVAEELGITVSALEGRLKRAKKQLRLRLIRRGVTLAVAVATLKATRVAAGEVPEQLTTQAIGICCGSELSIASGAATTTNPATQLALEELKIMNAILISKPLAVVASLAAVATLVVGVQIAVSQSPPGGDAAGVVLNAQAETVNEDTADAAAFAATAEAAPTTDVVDNREAQFDWWGRPIKTAAVDATAMAESVATTQSTGESSPQTGFSFTSPKRNPAFYDLKPYTPTEREIYQALARTVGELNFEDEPLEQVILQMQAAAEIPIRIDRVALEDNGIGPDEPVTIRIKEVKLTSALRYMLRELDLTYIVKDEVLLITTPEVAESTLETRVYPVAHLDFYSDQHIDFDQIIEAIVSTTATDTWAENGGGKADIRPVGDALAISQTFAVHEEIKQLFQQLEEVARQSKAREREGRERNSRERY